MIVVFSFNSNLRIDTFPDSFNFDGGVSINNEHYELSNSPIGFELGFYNYLVRDNQLIGVNFQFNTNQVIIDNFFSKEKYEEVVFANDELFIFFNRVIDYSVDYSQDFLDFYLMKSKNGFLAFSINIGENFDYELPSPLLKRMP